MFTLMKQRATKTLRPHVIIVVLAVSGCARNYVHPNFEQRISGQVKATGLLVRIESIGLEHGGLKQSPRRNDESIVFMAMRNMQQLFSQAQLQQMGTPELHLPDELTEFGYEKSEADRDTTLLAGLLESAIDNPQQSVRGEELEAVKRLASRTEGDIVLLGEIRSRVHTSEESRSTANLLAILAAAGGQYGAVSSKDTISSKWVVIDPADGKVLRTLQDNWQLP